MENSPSKGRQQRRFLLGKPVLFRGPDGITRTGWQPEGATYGPEIQILKVFEDGEPLPEDEDTPTDGTPHRVEPVKTDVMPWHFRYIKH
jgi:hypothetical protein